MRILIATVYGNYGGSTKVLLAAAKALEQRFDVVLRAPFEAASSRAPLTFPIETLTSLGTKLARVPLLWRLVVAEWRHVGACRPDVIYVHDTPSLIVYGLIARVKGLEVVYHVHSAEGRGPSRRLRDRLTDAKIYIARFLVDPAWTGPSFLIPNPVAVPKVPPRDRSAKRQLYLAASISERKNQILAVHTLAELCRRGHDATLHLCGPVLDAAYQRRLEAAIRDTGLGERVVLAGVLAPEEIYGQADVILCPSLFEVQPLVLLEALAAGVPVAASRIPAHEEIVATAGLPADTVLAELDAKAFADRIEALEPARFTDARARVESAFSEARFADAIIGAFGEMEKRLGKASGGT